MTPLSHFAWMLGAGAVLAATAAATGCTETTSRATSASDAGLDASTRPTPALVCLAVFDCAGPCAEGDQACEDACLEQASPEARPLVTALVDCFVQNACADATCIRSKCARELGACVDQSKPAATAPPSTGTPPTGDVPADLVGTWGHSSYGTFRRYVFNADGTATWELGTTSVTGCPVTYATTQVGTATFAATSFTFHGGSATTTRFECGQKSEVEEPARTWTSDWQLEAGRLRVVDRSDCPHTDQANVEFYCTFDLDRQ